MLLNGYVIGVLGLEFKFRTCKCKPKPGGGGESTVSHLLVTRPKEKDDEDKR